MRPLYHLMLATGLAGCTLTLTIQQLLSIEWRLFRLFLIILLVVELSLLLYELVTNSKRKLLANVLTSFYGFLVILLLLESSFMFVMRSHGGFMSLSSKLWLNEYWNPNNSLGYRDDEPTRESYCILFVGDSFTEGHGIDHVSQRFSNVVKSRLKNTDPTTKVINIGRSGSNTQDEFARMITVVNKLKLKPKTIVLQYCVNDIEDQAFEYGMKLERPIPYSNIPSFTVPIFKGSYLLDYIYWGIRGPSHYMGFLEQAYGNETIKSAHFKELDAFVDYCELNSIQLIPVIIPFMEDLTLSENLFVNPVSNHFKSRGIEAINVAELVVDIPFRRRIVNNSDRHASVEVNALMAHAIVARLQKADQ